MRLCNRHKMWYLEKEPCEHCIDTGDMLGEGLIPPQKKVLLKDDPFIVLPPIEVEALDTVHHPPHYKYGKIECMDYIEDQGLENDHHLASAIQYIVRCPHKGTLVEDLEKAIWYLNRRIKKEKG